MKDRSSPPLSVYKNDVAILKPGAVKALADVKNNVLDKEYRYQKIDLLRHVSDDHLIKKLSLYAANLTNIPESTCFLMIMAVYASCACRQWKVRYRSGKDLPIGIFVIAEQPSGVGKTWLLSIGQAPFYEIQKKVVRQIELSLSDSEVSVTKTVADKAHICDLAEKLITAKGPIFVTNSTPEGLEKTLIRNKGGFSAISSEQGLLNSLLGLSYSTGASNNDLLLNSYDGGFVNTQRVTREGYSGKSFGGVGVFAQSGSVEIVFNASNGTGVSERFTIVVEPHSLGIRDHTKNLDTDFGLLREYQKTCSFFEEVISNPKSIDEIDALCLSKNGYDMIGEFRNKIEPHLADGGKFSHISLRGSASKVDMQIMKLAANLHLLGGSHPRPSEIADKHVKSAIGIANELLEANLILCRDKGIIGAKAEYTSILTLFENDQKPRTYRNIMTVKVKSKPFVDFTGCRSDLIKKTLDEMVVLGLLKLQVDPEGKSLYGLGQ